ncbi:coatomer subunit beta'-like isoform X2 [Gordionus sp. m RMFG-2023]|uniref:coatomer subunit beta'-like isoform X2 n=1 Tax=Gordionus sp. m RMFG-2023 TaxID=3053472 RepID=UPI0031FD4CEC
MPLRLDIKRKLTSRSDRVKCIDLHPTESWMMASLYNGQIHIWNYESQQLIKTFEVCDLPVRVAKFISRKNWIVCGADDMNIRIYNYNTLERLNMFEAHSDYVRSIAVHPSQPYILTSSDDMLIKLWDWDKKWVCSQVFEGHSHYVMQVVFNPKDNNIFASASLDRTLKVWQLGSNVPNFTLDGHEKGVNCVDYYPGGEKPYLISGADDRMVKIWDYQNKTCVQTLEGHAQNISCVVFHPDLPIIMTGSEDGTVKIWHTNTYRLENTLNYGMERVWAIACQRGSNSIALGYDDGSILLKLGREEPAVSMDGTGKIIWAKHSLIQQANVKALAENLEGSGNEKEGEAVIKDGQILPLNAKDMGSCEIFPQFITHSPNGRFVTVCGDGEYIIYTSMALRNKSFGSGLEFVWGLQDQYALRENSGSVKVFNKNFKEQTCIKPEYGCEGIFGGYLLGSKTSNSLSFYDWQTTELVRRIEIQAKNVYWSETGSLITITTDDNYFILKYNQDIVAQSKENKELVTEDGIEDAFAVISEIQDNVKTGLWIGDCFIYTNAFNRLNYYVGGEVVTIAHLNNTLYILGYIPTQNRVYLCDKELNVISYTLLLSVLQYQTAVMRKDFAEADKLLPSIPKEHRSKVAHFLEKQGFKKQALVVSSDPEHKFELALQLNELKLALEIAQDIQSEQKWKQLAETCMTSGELEMAKSCLFNANDLAAILLLAECLSDSKLMQEVAEKATISKQYNIAFLAMFKMGKASECLDILIKSNRLPEAAFFARSYIPSQLNRVVKLWKENLSNSTSYQKLSKALANPGEYDNLFPGYKESLLAEKDLDKNIVPENYNGSHDESVDISYKQPGNQDELDKNLGIS